MDPIDEKHDQTIWMKIKNGDFAWGDQGEPTIRNVNIEANNGELVAIVGSVGSGKSSLIQAGNLKNIFFEINYKKALTPFLQRTSVQNLADEMILLYSDFHIN